MNQKYLYTVFNNDLKPVSSVTAQNSLEAIELARKPWLLNPIVENTTLLKRKDPNHKPTTGLEFMPMSEAGLTNKPHRRATWLH